MVDKPFQFNEQAHVHDAGQYLYLEGGIFNFFNSLIIAVGSLFGLSLDGDKSGGVILFSVNPPPTCGPDFCRFSSVCFGSPLDFIFLYLLSRSVFLRFCLVFSLTLVALELFCWRPFLLVLNHLLERLS